MGGLVHKLRFRCWSNHQILKPVELALPVVAIKLDFSSYYIDGAIVVRNAFSSESISALSNDLDRLMACPNPQILPPPFKALGGCKALQDLLSSAQPGGGASFFGAKHGPIEQVSHLCGFRQLKSDWPPPPRGFTFCTAYFLFK